MTRTASLKYNILIHAQHNPKHKLEKWFIIFSDETKQTDQRVKSLFKLVLWLVLGRGSLYDPSLVLYIFTSSARCMDFL